MKTAAQVLAQPGSAKCNAATSRMDFDAVCRSLFQPDAPAGASWPLTVSSLPSLPVGRAFKASHVAFCL